ncbi:MAG TPA: hypothetical protein VFI31_28485 [Pirellulales bacterium]|nr:hypothetical protein [Pirellulales bacterium]
MTSAETPEKRKCIKCGSLNTLESVERVAAEVPGQESLKITTVQCLDCVHEDVAEVEFLPQIE